MKKLLSICAAALCLGWACSTLATTNPKAAATEAATKLEASETAKNDIFKGIVKKTENGPALETDSGLFPLIGGDFEMIVGEKVNIVGKLVNEDNVQKIAVAQVQYNKQ